MESQERSFLEMQGISKHFGATKALDGVNFVCERAQIHAVLDENGAGKSTLMKLISGVFQPTEGEIYVDGREVRIPSPKVAGDLGLVCMFQELSLVPDLTVRENLLLSAPGSGLGWLKSDALQKAQDVLPQIDGQSIKMSDRVADLTLPQRQQVEIAKALMKKPRLLILDEATSALNSSVVEKVFDCVRKERDAGTSVLFISHRFHEIEALADRISVFRNGQRVETFNQGDHSYSEIINMMVGQKIQELFPPKPAFDESAESVLEVQNFSWDDAVKNVNLRVRKGEIVGLGGLDGQRQNSFLIGLFGLLKETEGAVRIGGSPVTINTPKAAKQADVGLALIPEDRKTEGLIQDQSIVENLELAAIGLDHLDASNLELYEASLDQLELKHGGLDLAVSSLSGGNQQKVVLAKWLALKPRCLLLADPTRGIDVKTKTQIYNILRTLADQGTAIVLLSTDYEELIHLCDETHIFYDGRIVSTLSGDDLTAQNIIAASLNIPADLPPNASFAESAADV
ncbi:MAG: sugar ABC transporter ATP-binding protein [Pseudomonadota bacterium]